MLLWQKQVSSSLVLLLLSRKDNKGSACWLGCVEKPSTIFWSVNPPHSAIHKETSSFLKHLLHWNKFHNISSDLFVTSKKADDFWKCPVGLGRQQLYPWVRVRVVFQKTCTAGCVLNYCKLVKGLDACLCLQLLPFISVFFGDATYGMASLNNIYKRVSRQYVSKFAIVLLL